MQLLEQRIADLELQIKKTASKDKDDKGSASIDGEGENHEEKLEDKVTAKKTRIRR